MMSYARNCFQKLSMRLKELLAILCRKLEHNAMYNHDFLLKIITKWVKWFWRLANNLKLVMRENRRRLLLHYHFVDFHISGSSIRWIRRLKRDCHTCGFQRMSFEVLSPSPLKFLFQSIMGDVKTVIRLRKRGDGSSCREHSIWQRWNNVSVVCRSSARLPDSRSGSLILDKWRSAGDDECWQTDWPRSRHRRNLVSRQEHSGLWRQPTTSAWFVY